jgi:hypothetical protein
MIYLTSGNGREVRELIATRCDAGMMWSYPKRRLGEARFAALRATMKWAGDNGCFTRPDLDVDSFLAWAESQADDRANCLFIVAPDVVGDARTTLTRSGLVLPELRLMGFPAALVAQDGLEFLSVPWEEFDVLFIGGSTEWKLSAAAREVTRQAKERGKWIHMGRVNSHKRFKLAVEMGCDSADGSHAVFAPYKNTRQIANWLSNPLLWEAGAE